MICKNCKPVLIGLFIFALTFDRQGMAQVTFTDGTFNPVQWTSTKILDNTPGQSATFTAQQLLLGGNPGFFRRVSHTYVNGTIFVAHVKGSAVYDPATQGAISSVCCSLEGKALNQTGAVFYSPLLVQNGFYYRSEGTTVASPDWTPVHLGPLYASGNFTVVGPGPAQPDFSAGGAPITLGYLTGNTGGPQPDTRESGLDNWEITINPSFPCNDDCNAAAAVTDGNYEFSMVGATGAGPQETAGGCDFPGNAGAPDVWFRYRAPTCSGTVTVSLCGSSFDTFLAVYGSCPTAAGQFLVCNDDDCGNQSEVMFPANGNAEYLIRILGVGGAQGIGTMTISSQTPSNCLLRGDMNCDGTLNGIDIQEFVNALLGV